MERLDQLVFAHRRLLAAVCAGVTVLLVLSAVRADGETGSAVVVDRDLPAGTVLTASDLRVTSLPVEALPDGAATDRGDVAGRTLVGPARAGEVLTDRRVLDPRDLGGYAVDDPALVPVRLADTAALGMLRVGDRVDVVAVDPQGQEGPRVVAAGAVVVSVPTTEGRSAGEDAIGVVTDTQSAGQVAAAGLSAALAVVAR